MNSTSDWVVAAFAAATFFATASFHWWNWRQRRPHPLLVNVMSAPSRNKPLPDEWELPQEDGMWFGVVATFSNPGSVPIMVKRVGLRLYDGKPSPSAATSAPSENQARLIEPFGTLDWQFSYLPWDSVEEAQRHPILRQLEEYLDESMLRRTGWTLGQEGMRKPPPSTRCGHSSDCRSPSTAR